LLQYITCACCDDSHISSPLWRPEISVDLSFASAQFHVEQLRKASLASGSKAPLSFFVFVRLSPFLVEYRLNGYGIGFEPGPQVLLSVDNELTKSTLVNAAHCDIRLLCGQKIGFLCVGCNYSKKVLRDSRALCSFDMPNGPSPIL
jgi:hypothetical protein